MKHLGLNTIFQIERSDIIFLIILIVIVLFISLLVWWFSGGRHRLYLKKAKKIFRNLQEFKPGEEGKMIAYLRKINPYVFEELLLIAFEKKGYKVYRNKRYSGDGGIDGRVKKDGVLYFVQAKRYKSHVNNKHVAAFVDVCRENDVKGFFVHTGKTGKNSLGIVIKSDRVQIISGKNLIALLKSNA